MSAPANICKHCRTTIVEHDVLGWVHDNGQFSYSMCGTRIDDNGNEVDGRQARPGVRLP